MAITKRSKNSYMIEVDVGRDANGKRKRIRETFRGTKKEAQLREAELKVNAKKGICVNSSNITVGEYLQHWIETQKPQLKPLTYDSYLLNVEKHLIPYFGNIKLKDLKPIQIETYISQKLQNGRTDGSGGLAARTVEYHLVIFQKALQHAVDVDEIIYRNVAKVVKAPSYEEPEFSPTFIDDVIKLLREATHHKDYDIIYTAIGTGLRRGELLGLGWHGIDFENCTARITRSVLRKKNGGWQFGTVKTKRSKRSVYLPPGVMEILAKRKKEQVKFKQIMKKNYIDYNLVFCNEDGTPLDPGNFSNRFTRLAEKLEINLTVKSLRHAYATLMMKYKTNSKVVQELMGHSTINVTMNTYSHMLPVLQEEAVLNYEENLTKEINSK